MDYSEYNDYELISYINEGNEQANNIIIKKYEPLINKIASKMIRYCSNTGLEKSDLVQEGMIGLNHAISYFKEQKEASFYTYSKTCIERRMISSIVSAKRLKHKILNESLSYDNEIEDMSFESVFKDETMNPENIMVDIDSEYKLMENIKNNLTELEDQVFELMISGFSYREIADILDKEVKSIDNTIQRIRNKVKKEIQKINNENLE